MNSMNKLIHIRLLALILASVFTGLTDQATASTSEKSTFWSELRSEFQLVPIENRRLRPHRLWWSQVGRGSRHA